MTCASCWRNSPGAVSACAAAAFLSASPCSNSGSFDSANCVSVTSASAISELTSCLPASRLSCSAGAGLGTAPVAGIGTACPGGSGPIGVTGFGIGLRLVRRSIGRGLDVGGLTLLALAHQTLDVALDLAGLPRRLVVVGLLQRLRRLRLDRRLHRRDERLLVERARPLGLHRVRLGRLGLRPDITRRRHRRVLGLLGLRRGRRMRPLLPPGRLDLAGDRSERRIGLRSNAARRHRRLQPSLRRSELRSGRRAFGRSALRTRLPAP